MKDLPEHGSLVGDWLAMEGSRLVVATGKVDLGQRISTALRRIAAGELGLPLEAVEVRAPVTGTAPDEGITSGSNSIIQSGASLRAAAATARGALLELAADALAIAPGSVRLRDGLAVDPQSNRSVALADLWPDLPGDLVLDPSAPLHIPPAGITEAPPAPPSGMADMVRGAHRYVHDLRLEGMLHARVVRPPHDRARLIALDPDSVTRTEAEGLRIVQDGSFIAVAGTPEWQVIRATRRLASTADWDTGDGLPEGDPVAMLDTLTRITLSVRDGLPVRETPATPLDAPDVTVTMHRPYQMHAALGPSAALAVWDGALLDITCHSQGIYPLRKTMAEALGMAETAIRIAHMPGSGCYGHNGADDAAFDAALVALAIKDRPVLLKWTREEEHAFEPYFPATTVTVSARLEKGRIAAWSAEATGDTHRGRPRPGAHKAGPKRLLASRFREDALAPYIGEPNMNREGGLHRNLEPPYAVGPRRLVKNLVPSMPLRTSALRTLGATLNVVAAEQAMDLLAESAGADPLAFRRAHLDDPDHARVVAALGEAWTAPMVAPEAGAEAVVGRGVGYARYKNAAARVGAVADVSVSAEGEIAVSRLFMAADAGRVVDPDGLRAQLEGGALQALSWLLIEEVRWDRDGILTRDWDSYPVLRFDQVPEIAIKLIDRPDTPSLGAGEAACGPVAAAIAGAVRAAVGFLPSRMPFTPEVMRDTAMAL
ncbi:MAG: molybdopterin cofactor-binding domain-containing protein [Pseudomonadota bacterium]